MLFVLLSLAFSRIHKGKVSHFYPKKVHHHHFQHEQKKISPNAPEYSFDECMVFCTVYSRKGTDCSTRCSSFQ